MQISMSFACEWFCIAQFNSIPLTGMLIQEKALSREMHRI